MKKFLLLLIVSAIVISCKKNVLSINRNDLSGSWKLVHISGGFAGIDSVPTANIYINFEKNNYTKKYEYAIISAGTFTITKAGEPNYYYSETLLNLFSTSDGESTYGVHVSNDSLVLDEGCCDQFSYTYVKQK